MTKKRDRKSNNIPRRLLPKQQEKKTVEPKIDKPQKFHEYILFNPAYDVTLIIQLLKDKAMTRMLIKGTPEDFTGEHENQLFYTVRQEITVHPMNEENNKE